MHAANAPSAAPIAGEQTHQPHHLQQQQRWQQLNPASAPAPPLDSTRGFISISATSARPARQVSSPPHTNRLSSASSALRLCILNSAAAANVILNSRGQRPSQQRKPSQHIAAATAASASASRRRHPALATQQQAGSAAHSAIAPKRCTYRRLAAASASPPAAAVAPAAANPPVSALAPHRASALSISVRCTIGIRSRTAGSEGEPRCMLAAPSATVTAHQHRRQMPQRAQQHVQRC
jgi:hypothetical protein